MNGDTDFQKTAIEEFIKAQRNLEESANRADDLLDEKVDLLYRFNDDERQTPALGFVHLADDIYREVYCDPSIEALWQDWMG